MNFIVKKAEDLGPLFSKNDKRLAGCDGGYSIPLNNGKSLWFFGDTLIGKREPGKSLWYEFGLGEGEVNMSGCGNFDCMLDNTGILVPNGPEFSGGENFSPIVNDEGKIFQLIPAFDHEKGDTEYRVWCYDGCMVGDTLYLYYMFIKMKHGEPLLANFEMLGSGLAKADPNTLEFTRIKNGDDKNNLFWKDGTPYFGSAVYHDEKENWVYVFGFHTFESGKQASFLSRVKSEEIENIESYMYWDGEKQAWSSVLRHATPVFENMPNELSVSWNEYLGKYTVIHSLGMTGKVVMRTADNIYGPWSEPKTIWEIDPIFPATDKFFPLLYAGKEHPEMSPDGGKTIFFHFIEFEEYWPHLVKVELEKND